jgi:hypothetical protein
VEVVTMTRYVARSNSKIVVEVVVCQAGSTMVEVLMSQRLLAEEFVEVIPERVKVPTQSSEERICALEKALQSLRLEFDRRTQERDKAEREGASQRLILLQYREAVNRLYPGA